MQIQLDLEIYGEFGGSFAGGKKAIVKESIVESITIGEFKVQNVPVHILNLGNIKFGDEEIHGIIGTVFFYHFITSLDYPKGKLILRKKTTKISKDKLTSIPIWLVGDHYTIARGKVNDGPEVLLFIDTGLAGGGFTCSNSMIKLANIELDKEKEFNFRGGGGITKAIPFILHELALGEIKRNNISGVFFDLFPLEEAFGFYIGGIISHQFFRESRITFDYDRMIMYLE